jgi:maleylpyruvate isomerase
MTTPAIPMIDLLAASSNRMLSTLSALDDNALRAPSLLPGWTRGHVATHIARNGDAIRNLFQWARTGEPSLMYPSRDVRNADIEGGSGRAAQVLLDDLAATVERLSIEIRHLPDAAWSAEVFAGPGPMPGDAELRPITLIVGLRLFEVEVHHVDLGAGYTFGSTPPALAVAMIGFALQRVSVREDQAAPSGFELRTPQGSWPVGGGGPVVVEASVADALAWLLGRSDGAGVATADGTALPLLNPI